jgi:hypothetical protein
MRTLIFWAVLAITACTAVGFAGQSVDRWIQSSNQTEINHHE